MAVLRPRRRQGGFTILEMSVVLVVIALIIGAVSIGRDVYRSAVAERISTEFVQAWIVAYDRYVAQVGTVPGDSLSNPTGRIKGTGNELCDTTGAQELRDEMLEHGISLPSGRAEGMESRYAYQDANGLPQEIRVCFLTLVDWAEPASGSSYTGRPRNVMRLEGLTPELARQLDNRIDGRVDARFGRLREDSQYDDTSSIGSPPSPNPWSKDDLDTRDGRPDGQVETMTAYLKMNQ
ncbi:prepilin-type cleavage/methylation domain-containing protein [Pseudoxanthomonas jiangsuensis]|uniref:type II secretion system protein n=1 Tax=Pseudoxanthomonas jiangsuensis TaxID=619688 RepID=UPI0013913FF5|nr:type II secretion system protein [Pseudoxanthomonas jiangsuensis]KAF1698649.1 prepilin-type cleavage/methylation domain-containing protein [Pseudoxanthomonas jiangsuensis]